MLVGGSGEAGRWGRGGGQVSMEQRRRGRNYEERGIWGNGGNAENEIYRRGAA
jgi:hypothetical protein